MVATTPMSCDLTQPIFITENILKDNTGIDTTYSVRLTSNQFTEAVQFAAANFTENGFPTEENFRTYVSKLFFVQATVDAIIAKVLVGGVIDMQNFITGTYPALLDFTKNLSQNFLQPNETAVNIVTLLQNVTIPTV